MRKDRGFTLIEILVVVSILGVLMGLISILVIRSAHHQRINQTTMAIAGLKIKIERWKQEFKRLPPMTVKGLASQSERWKGLSIDNQTNECNECLLVALRHADFSTPLEDDDLNLEEPFGNTDEDSWTQTPYGSQTADALEILDAWGRPIVYIDKNSYDQPVTIVNPETGETVEVMARKKPDGSWYNPAGFQLISLGEDGKPDEDGEIGDDLVNFTKKED